MARVEDGVREVYKTLDLALRVGEILLSSGAGAADVTATMLGITDHLGLRNADIDVTFTALRMSFQTDPDELPVTLNRNIRQRDIDYDDLTKVHKVVIDLLTDSIDRDEARAAVARINSTGHWVPRWGVAAGFGVVGGGVALTMGAQPVIVFVAVVAGVGIQVLQRALSRRRLPLFYQQLAGGMFASLLAVGVAAVAPDTNPSRIITAAIVLLLAGVGFMGAMQDALSGFYITASARVMEVMLATAGVIAGVAAGIALANSLGLSLGRVTPGAYALSDLWFMLVGGAVAAVGFAFSCYAPKRSFLAIAVIAALGYVVYAGIQLPGLGKPWSAGLAALFIGVVSYSVAGRVRVPPLVVVVPAMVPILPGLSIYRALSYMALNQGRGVLALFSAAAVTIALAAGVILGEYVAQPLKRNARKVESRLAGPRMVGMLHGQARRARRPLPPREPRAPREPRLSRESRRLREPRRVRGRR